MKILIANKLKMVTHEVPSKVEESFLIPYKSLIDSETKTIPIEPSGERWKITANLNISIYNNKAPMSEIYLEDNKTFEIKFNETDEMVYLFCIANEEEFKDFNKINDLKVGSDSNNNIVYDNPLVEKEAFTLSMNDKEKWVIKKNDENIDLYVNDLYINEKEKIINHGDIIFLFGLKIIPMLGFIKINQINGVNVKGLEKYTITKADNSKYVKSTTRQKNSNLYKESDYFFHTPSLKPSCDEEVCVIDRPPQKQEESKIAFLVSVGSFITLSVSSLAGLASSFFQIMAGKATLQDELISIIVAITMFIGSVIFPVIVNALEKKMRKEKEKKRLTKYQEYLNDRKKFLDDAMKNQSNVLKQLYPSSKECYNMIINKQNLWSREINDNDFLAIKIGDGEERARIRIDSQRLEFTLEEDVLRDKLKEIQDYDLTLKDVPITVNLAYENVFGIILKCLNKKNYINSVLLQFMSLFSSGDLKLVFLVSDKNKSLWEDYKFLGHTLSPQKDIRFFAYDDDDKKNISSYLDGIFQERINLVKTNSNDKINKDNTSEIYKNFETYYLIITDDILHAKNLEIIDKILNEQTNYGFSLLMFEDALKNIPSRANSFMEINDKEGILFNKLDTSKSETRFVPKFVNITNMDELIYILSNIPIAAQDAESVLPTQLEFLEMYKVGKIEQLNIQNRWINNNPTLSLNAPIGVHPNGTLFELNLHEKMHGPHGLIAGSTGSGKSEFIITYILSMCVNYSPLEVQFVLIDYKGGGLAGAFENRETGVKIPHLVGTITNLDTSEMYRTLVSIRSELKRRQKLFNEVRDALGESTIDIYKYQKHFRDGNVKEPIAHLFVISDEFAELKAQQPDFMNELISTARIGRSLGVHLILATQKPSGVVDDQIWSNTRFRVCLKVQSSSDSQEMLRRPEAASIKEAGRFYLQVGYDEIFELGQSAWSGAKYVAQDVIEKSIDDSINFINDSGTPIKTVNDIVKKDDVEDRGEQLTNIVKYLVDFADKENIKANDLWLPSIPKDIYLGNLIKKYNYKLDPTKYNAIIGEFDDPENQEQGLLTLDISTGNVILYGIPGSGKENQIETMLYSLCAYYSPKDINVYIMDFGAELLKAFTQMPQVGDYANAEEPDKVSNLLRMLEKEMQVRKEMFSNYGGTLTAYNNVSKEKMPLIFTIINSYEGFMESFSDYEDNFNRLFREGSKYGLIFLTTATAYNSVSSRTTQHFTNIFAMRLTDPFDYRYILNVNIEITPKNVFGRGLTLINERSLEYQSAYINIFESINKYIVNLAVNLNKKYKDKAKSIPIVPSKVNVKTMEQYINDLSNVPLGVEVKDVNISTYNFIGSKIHVITGKDIKMAQNFLEEFYNIMPKVPNTTISMFDSFYNVNIPSTIAYTTNNIEFVSIMNQVVTKEEQILENRIVIVAGIKELFESIDEDLQKQFASLLENNKKYVDTTFIIIDDYENLRSLSTEKWYRDNVSTTDVVWVGNGFDSQILFQADEVEDSTEDLEYTYDVGYVLTNGKAKLVKFISKDN